MKKKEEYTPLFGVDTEENAVLEQAICKCCKKSVKKNLLDENGFCIECVMNNNTSSKNAYAFPNEKVFNSFFQQYKIFKKQNKHQSAERSFFKKLTVAALPGGLYKAAVHFSPDAPDTRKPLKNENFTNYRIGKSSFDKCNKLTVKIRDASWVCPCCYHDNLGAHFCDVCGVYPKFKLED